MLEADLHSKEPGKRKRVQAAAALGVIGSAFCRVVTSAMNQIGAEFFETAHAAAASGSAWGWLAAKTAS